MSDLGVEQGQIVAGKYRVVKLLGQGGMGSVWAADHLTLKSPIALKIIKPALARKPKSLARFLAEAKAAAKLRSPHVVQIFDHGSEKDFAYICMELLEGEDLAQRLKREGHLSLSLTRRVMTHVGRAVQRAHDAGLVHRDLKPANIHLVPNDDEIIAKVLDFGIAKILDPTLDDSDSPRTATGALLGTPNYMSPEQLLSGQSVDNRTDLWALGIIAYELVCGTRPFSGDSIGDYVLAICSTPMPIPSAHCPVPRGFDAWFAHATERDPEQRFDSAKAMCKALGEVLDNAPAQLELERTAHREDAKSIAVDADAASAMTTATSHKPMASVQNKGAGRGQEATKRSEAAVDDSALPTVTSHDTDDPIVELPASQQAATGSSRAPSVDEEQSKPPQPAAVAEPRTPSWLWPAALVASTAIVLLVWRSAQTDERVESPSTQSTRVSATSGSTPATVASKRSKPTSSAKSTPNYGQRLRAVVARHIGATERCFDEKDAPTKAVRRSIDFAIDKDGRVTRCDLVERATNTPKFDTCILDIFRWMRFPSPGSGEVTITYPLSFAPTAHASMDDEACREGRACQRNGACSAKGKRCVAGSDQDCKQAQVCVQRGQCKMSQGRCITDATDCAADSGPCERYGLCTEQKGRCVASSTRDCSTSRACKKFGHCEARDGVCIATNDEHCSASKWCAVRGLCGRRSDWCSAETAAQCKSSERCKTDGACSVLVSRCAPRTDADCSMSEVCSTLGWCGVSKFDTCRANEDKHCAASDLCKREQRCLAKSGSCVKEHAPSKPSKM